MQVDVGIATALVAALDERLTVLIKSHPSEYLKDSLDVKIAGFAEEGLKVKVFLMWKYTFSREFVNGVPHNPLQSAPTPVAASLYLCCARSTSPLLVCSYSWGFPAVLVGLFLMVSVS